MASDSINLTNPNHFRTKIFEISSKSQRKKCSTRKIKPIFLQKPFRMKLYLEKGKADFAWQICIFLTSGRM